MSSRAALIFYQRTFLIVYDPDILKCSGQATLVGVRPVMRIFSMGVNWGELRLGWHARGNSTDQSRQTKRFSYPDAR